MHALQQLSSNMVKHPGFNHVLHCLTSQVGSEINFIAEKLALPQGWLNWTLYLYFVTGHHNFTLTALLFIFIKDQGCLKSRKHNCVILPKLTLDSFKDIFFFYFPTKFEPNNENVTWFTKTLVDQIMTRSNLTKLGLWRNLDTSSIKTTKPWFLNTIKA